MLLGFSAGGCMRAYEGYLWAKGIYELRAKEFSS